MFGDRWRQIVGEKANFPAITTPDAVVSFGQLDALAAAMILPAQGPVYAQGSAVQVAAALIAGWSAGRVVQVLEADRPPHLPESAPPAATALIKQTVGASGVRRCQFFSLEQVMADVDRLHAALKLAEHSAVVAPISMGHSYGLSVGVFQVLRHGVHLVWLPHPFPGPLTEALENREHVLLAGVPSLWKAWCMSGVAMGAVRTGVSAGATLTVALEQRLRDSCGIKVRTLYGTSETGAVALDTCDAVRQADGEVGQVLPGVEVRTVDHRLHVRSSSTGIGYDIGGGSDVFADGGHLTWDIGAIHEGKLHLHGTCGAGINVAGRKLSPTELAAKIRQSTGLDVVISGFKSRDPERCEEVAAQVPLPASELTADFKAKACELLAPWEVPRRWVAMQDG